MSEEGRTSGLNFNADNDKQWATFGARKTGETTRRKSGGDSE